MAVTITYGGVDLFGSQPIPFVSKDVNYVQIGETFCQEETITLNGQFVGCSESELKGYRTALLNKLLTNYQALHIDGLGTNNPTFPTVKIESVSFEDSDYVNSLPYSITFLHYPEVSFTSLYSNSYGVIDVSDEISYRESENRVLEVTRTVSAKGINTSTLIPGNAITNAQNFINERINDTLPQSFFIESTSSDFNGYLVSSQETIDRINSTVSITQNFRSDLDDAKGDVINRYTINVSEQLGEFPRVTYNGQVNAGRYGNIDNCFQKYENLKGSISNASYIFDENVTQDSYINQLSYSFSFFSGEGAEKLPKIEDDFSISVSEDSSSSLFSVSLNGTLRYAYGCFTENDGLTTEFDSVRNSNYHFGLCKDIYEEFYTEKRGSAQVIPDNVALNPIPISRNESRKYSAGGGSNNLEISYSINFNDRYVPNEFVPDVDSTEYFISFGDSITITPPISKQQISEHYIGGKYSCNDLGYVSRQRIDINLEFNGSDLSLATIGECRDFGNLIYGYLGTTEENKRHKVVSESFNESEEAKTASYQVSHSDGESVAFVI